MSNDERQPKPHLRMDRRGFLTLVGVGAGASAAGLATPTAAQAQPGQGHAPIGTAGSNAPTYPGAPESSGFYTEDFSERGEHAYGNYVEFAKALRDYDPRTDPDARYVRSHVPRAERVPARRATQATPALDPRPGVTELSLHYMPLTSDEIRYDHGEYEVDANHQERWNEFQFRRYGWSRNMYLPRQHAYRDILGSWAASWELTTVMFNPAYADLAHRNGQRAIGIVHGPYLGPAEPTSEAEIAHAKYSFTAQDDDGFVYGRKLVELAQYFGYDGTFLNFEAEMAASQAAEIEELVAFTKEYAADQGMPDFYLQWYDSLRTDGSIEYHNALSPENAHWLTATPNDSIFLNYWWYEEEVARTKEVAERSGIDPFSQVYFGIEMEDARGEDPALKWRAHPEGDATWVIPPDGSGEPVASIGLFDPVQQLVTWSRRAVGTGSLDAISDFVYRAEREFWSGPTGDPSDLAGPDDKLGAAHFFTERSVIGALPFVTRFNTGGGSIFALEGEDVSAHGDWFNIGVQDLLPTWQWWRLPLAESGTLASVDFDLTTAWDGPASLAIDGPAGAVGTQVRLFRTELEVPSDAVATITFKASAGTELSLGLVRGDAAEDVEWLALKGRGTGWQHATVPLPAGAHLTTVALGVAPSEPGEEFWARIGAISMTAAGSTFPPRPSSLHIEDYLVHDDATLADVRLLWERDDSVWYYDITGDAPRGGQVWLGRITGDAYYAEDVPRPGSRGASRIRVTPVGMDGTRGASSTVVIHWHPTRKQGND